MPKSLSTSSNRELTLDNLLFCRNIRFLSSFSLPAHSAANLCIYSHL